MAAERGDRCVGGNRVASKFGGGMYARQMIVIDTDARLPAHRLLPRWLELYRTVSRRQGPRHRVPVVRAPAAPASDR